MSPRVVDMGQVEMVGAARPINNPSPAPVNPKRGTVAPKTFRADHRQVAEALSQRLGKPVDAGKVALKLIDRDLTPKFDAHRSRVEWQVWDKVSPVNGVPADQILGRPEYAAAEQIYLVSIDGRIVFFQPHLPEAAGIQRMTEEGAEWVAAVHAEQVVDQMAFEEVVAELEQDQDLVAVDAALDANAIAAAVADALADQQDPIGNRPPRRRR